MEQDYLYQSALDEMAGSDTLQFLKALIPYLPLSTQSFLSVCIKTQELFNTISALSQMHNGSQLQAASTPALDPLDILDDIRNHCHGEIRSQLDQLINTLVLFQTLELMNQEVTP